MRIYISCDLEGISGVVHSIHTNSKGRDYERARKLMTAEVNAAVVGAYEAGAEEVVINDAHGDMKNIIIENLDPRAKLITGDIKPLSMVQGVEDNFSGAFFIGYHAGAGVSSAILSHTYYGQVVSLLKINDLVVNETLLNALVAGYFNTPVALISGDAKTCEEAKKVLENIETVIVKWAISRYTAKCLHPEEAQKRIKEAALLAVKNISRYKPFRIPGPYTVNLTMLNPGLADSAETMPFTRRVGDLTVQYHADNIIDVFKGIRTLICLASQAIPQI